MSVRRKIHENNGVFFITFTCARWLPLFEITNGYNSVYKWFDYLKEQRHHIVAYIIMPSHVHVVIAFSNSRSSINTIIGNGKRFMAYWLVAKLISMGKKELLTQMASWVNNTEQMINKKHEVFEPSFERKECYSIQFMKQKTDYIHQNPCKAGMVPLPEHYIHSSANIITPGSRADIRLLLIWSCRMLIYNYRCYKRAVFL
jgi:REP element-mobilizing transposase RayT